MIQINKNIIKASLFSLLAVLASCDEDLLEVENTNDPAELIGSVSDAIAVSEELYHSFYDVTHDIEDIGSPSLALWTVSDVGTCSWGNFGMRDISSEPRTPFDNSPTYSSASISSSYWKGLYSVVTKSNGVLKSIETYDLGDDSEKVKALAYLNRGLAFGYLGLVYDKAYAVDEFVDLQNQSAILETEASYDVMVTKALEDLNMAISIANANSFTASENTIAGVTLDNVMLSKLANSYAARLMVYSARNSSENIATDWSRVLEYANNGITEDLIINIEIDTKWDDTMKLYSTYPGWGRIDMRIINMLDPSMPARWPDGGYDVLPNAGEATSADARLGTDFQYLSSNNFRPERGLYHYSSYRYARWDDTVLTFNATTVPEFWKSELDLLKAEAQLRTGDAAGAVETVNAGTRTTRGELSPTTLATVEADIFYERQIELILSTFGLEYFDMRRNDYLQQGTFLHFPVPGDQLQLIQESLYSFGGSNGVEGVDYSNGGWE